MTQVEPPAEGPTSAVTLSELGKNGRLARASSGTRDWLTRGAHRRELSIAGLGSVLLAVAMIWLIPPYAIRVMTAGAKTVPIADPAHTIVGDAGDPTAQAWLVGWGGHALTHGLRGLWDTNAFYPDKYGLALNDSLLGYAPAGLIGSGVVGAVLRYNILFVLAFALAFLGGYALLRQLGANKVAAAVAGAALAYAPWRYGHDGHLNILSTGGITLALAMLARGHGLSLTRGYLAERVRPGWAFAGWLVAAWQVSLGFGVGLGFVYVLAALCLITLTAWLIHRPRLGRRLIVGDLIGGLVFTAVTGYFAYAYQHVRELNPAVTREWDYVAHFSPTLRGLLVAPQSSLPWGTLHNGARTALGGVPTEKVLLCGYALYLLAFAGLFLSRWSPVQRLLLLFGAVVGVLFALGTNGPIYRLLYLYVPGFDGSRTPGRLILWPTLCLAILAAGLVTHLAEVARMGAKPKWSVGAARLLTVPLLVLVLAEGLPDLQHPQTPAKPAAMALASAHAPIMVLPSDDGSDLHVLLWSTDGFPAMVNGAASYTTPNRQATRDVMTTFPSEPALDRLHQLGIRSVVLLRNRVQGTPYEPLLDIPDVPGITRHDVGPDVVYTIDTNTKNP